MSEFNDAVNTLESLTGMVQSIVKQTEHPSPEFKMLTAIALHLSSISASTLALWRATERVFEEAK